MSYIDFRVAFLKNISFSIFGNDEKMLQMVTSSQKYA